MHDVRLQGICTISPNFLSTLQWRIQGRGPPPPPLFNWGPKGRKSFFRRSRSCTALVHLEGNSILDILCSLVRAWTMWFTSIFCYVTLPWQQYIWISQNRGPAKMAEKTKKFPAHDCTQELNSSPYLSSIDRQCKWPSLSRKIVEIQKFCSYW